MGGWARRSGPGALVWGKSNEQHPPERSKNLSPLAGLGSGQHSAILKEAPMSSLAERVRDRTGIDAEGYLTAFTFAALIGVPLLAILWIV